jgi:peptide/nickel transport system substrate-binding protein/glutathione transport system substrate-binding protein
VNRTHSKITIDRRSLLAGAAAASGMIALPHAALSQTPRRGGTLRWALPFNASSLDPMTGRTAGEFACLYTVFDALIDFDPVTLELKPGLAKAWAFPDPKTLTLELVEGVMFHDGTPFDAAAVKFNLDRYRADQRSNVKADLETVRDVTIEGQHRVTLHLDQPNAALPAILTDRVGMMVSPTHIRDKGPDVGHTPVGTGPFNFVSMQDNDRFIASRNDNYWKKGLPYLDSVNIAIITETATGVRSITAGENDLATTVGLQQKLVADRSGKLIVQATRVLSMFGIYLNYGRPPLDDKRIRQALNYAVDREALNKAVSFGLDEPTSAIIPKEHWASDPATLHYYNHDPAKAKQLLAQAGYPDGIDIPMLGWSDQISMQRQEVLVMQLAQSGIRIKLTPASPSASSTEFFGPAKKGAGRMSLIAARPDPSQQYDNLFSKTAYFNAGGVELPGYRELLAATLATNDHAGRKAAFANLQKFVVENALLVPVLFNTSVSVSNPRVRNFIVGLVDKPKVTEVWLAE